MSYFEIILSKRFQSLINLLILPKIYNKNNSCFVLKGHTPKFLSQASPHNFHIFRLSSSSSSRFSKGLNSNQKIQLMSFSCLNLKLKFKYSLKDYTCYHNFLWNYSIYSNNNI